MRRILPLVNPQYQKFFEEHRIINPRFSAKWVKCVLRHDARGPLSLLSSTLLVCYSEQAREMLLVLTSLIIITFGSRRHCHVFMRNFIALRSSWLPIYLFFIVRSHLPSPEMSEVSICCQANFLLLLADGRKPCFVFESGLFIICS